MVFINEMGLGFYRKGENYIENVELVDKPKNLGWCDWIIGFGLFYDWGIGCPSIAIKKIQGKET